MARAVFTSRSMVHVKIIRLLIFLYLDKVNFSEAQIRPINAFRLEVPVAALAPQYINYGTHYGH